MTAGKPSGTAAIARATASIIAWRSGSWWTKTLMAKTRATAMIRVVPMVLPSF